MSQRKRRVRVGLAVTVLAALALCAGIPYAVDSVGRIGSGNYRNTSPPLAATQGGVSFTVEHSRYLTTETITLELINHSNQPIYLPGIKENGQRFPYPPPIYPPSYARNVRSFDAYYACLAIETDYLGGRGWQALGTGCNWSWDCGQGNPPLLVPITVELGPGQTGTFPLYDGQGAYPPWKSGAYRFSVVYTFTPLTPPRSTWPSRLTVPDGVSLSTPPVTLTSAWWYPPWYHQTPPYCGRRD